MSKKSLSFSEAKTLVQLLVNNVRTIMFKGCIRPIIISMNTDSLCIMPKYII